MGEYKPGGIKIKQWTDEDMEYLDRQNLKLENDIKLLNKAVKALVKDSIKLEDDNIRLKQELDQQRFNNKHNLSIDQKIADEIARLKEELKAERYVINVIQDKCSMDTGESCDIKDLCELTISKRKVILE